MNKNKLTFLKIAIVVVLGVSVILSCEKKEVLNENEKKIEKLSVGYEKEKHFLSIMLAVPLDKVIYDENAKEFKVGERSTMSLEQVQGLYEEANEYKLVYEN